MNDPHSTSLPPTKRLHSYLQRLPAEWYRGKAMVHWSMTMEDRATGWLDERFHLMFREQLTHMGFLYHLIVPIYCLMPDHLHLLAAGFHEDSDQRLAMRFLRKHLNIMLRLRGVSLQKQGYDHVLRDDRERERDGFQDVAWYIRANPLRGGIVTNEDGLRDYPFLGCLLPGFPEVSIWDDDYWTRYWRIFAVREARGVNS
jgi:REP element-mobilizing transposase RayT